MIIAVAFVIAIAVLFLYTPRFKWQESTLEPRKAYWVLNVPDAQQAANALADIESTLSRFLRSCASHPTLKYDERIATATRAWTGTISEIDRDAENDVAYSLDKATMHLCVRDPVTGEVEGLEKRNERMFVCLHELSHMACDEVGHTPKFWKLFQFFLEAGEMTGAYVHDESLHSKSICGLQLGGSPLDCVKAKSCSSQLK